MNYTKLNIYLVTSKHLISRKKNISTNIDYLKKMAEELSLTVKIFMINDFEYKDIENSISDYNKRINYDVNNNDNDFKIYDKKLNIHQLSNIEKHRCAYNKIKNNKEDELNLIIEDDILLSSDYNKNLILLFNNIKNFDKWDIIFTCLSNNNENEPFNILNSRDYFKILISKSSYFIIPTMASKLYEHLNILNYQLKISISKFIFENKDINSYILNKHTFLEGSKIGLYLSSTNTNNFLYQNSDYINLSSYINKDKISNDDIIIVEKIYKNNQLNINNADFLHSMGLIYFKKNDYKNAKKYLIEAVNNIKKNEGLIANYSEVLNNCINMHQYDQPDIEECFSKQSKYS